MTPGKFGKRQEDRDRAVPRFWDEGEWEQSHSELGVGRSLDQS